MTRKKPARQGKTPEIGLALLAAGLFVASCATVESPLGPIGDASTPSGTKMETVVVGEGQDSYTVTRPASQDIDCPAVTIRTGASTWQLPGGTGPTNVRYQGTLGQLARECAILGETMTMRVGVEGRVLVGPKGGPGSVNVPLRIALVAEGPQPRPIWSKFYSVPVNVPPNATQAVFSQVEDDVTFPLPPNRRIDNYIVYVGFDPQGAASAAKSAPKAKTPAPAPKKASAPPAAKAPAPAPKAPAPAKSPPQFEPPPSPPPGVFAPPPGQGG